MAEKLSKKELKSPDAFQTTFERMGDYVLENKSRVMVVSAALVCAFVLAMGIYLYWTSYTNSSLKLYAKAQDNVSTNGENKEIINENVKIYQELIDRYSHSPSGRMAYYHLGNVYYQKGEMDKAIGSYEKFVSKTGSDRTGVEFLALTSIGYAYEAKKDYAKALKYFEKAQKVYSVGFESIAFRNLGRASEELNNKAKALEYYKKALEKTSEPSATIFIKRKISALS
jgi:tetratricopeptide (TPR) repeat protein